VFVSTPQFWSNLTFDYVRFVVETPCHFERLLSMANMCMERSRNHLLSFRFWIDIVSPTHPTRELLETLVRHSMRWHDVLLALPLSELRILYAAKNRLPAFS
jgi:hypothetical protein